MPKLVSEISSGTNFQFSSSQGQINASQTRAFRVLLDAPGEVINIQAVCGVRIGDQHPYNTGIYCRSYAAQYEGDSRTVIQCTFTYEATPGNQDDPNSKPPDIRPANWSTSTSISEVPTQTWYKIDKNGNPVGGAEPAANAAGDSLDGVTRLAPIITISVEQWESFDPTKNSGDAGRVNSNEFWIGTLKCFRRSLMFRGVTSRPAVESWGEKLYRGWICNYEFAYQQNRVSGIWDEAGGTYSADIGWDIAVPHTGFNVLAFDPAAAGADQDPYGQPLKHKNQKIQVPLALPDNIAPLAKVRGMVLVHEYETGGASQLPSAQPIPLNDDGTPRKNVANPPVLVYRRNPHDELDFKLLGLRLV